MVKVGSATLERGEVFAELARIVRRGARLLVVAGGAEGIRAHYDRIGRTVPELELKSGDKVRYCSPEEMGHIVDAYQSVTLPNVDEGLREQGLSVFTAVASQGGLVEAEPNRPLRVRTASGGSRVVRDHRVGRPERVDTARIATLLEGFDAVCVSPPVAGSDGGGPLNADADVLAAVLSNAMRADHLRLVTGTAGLLSDPGDPDSTLPHLYSGEGAPYAGGRMKQKVRAAEIALDGSADVAICGPHTMERREGWTRFWPGERPEGDIELLHRAASIPSVSRDERELVSYLVDRCREKGVEAFEDEAGNLVAVKGSSADDAARLMLMGHVDTVPAPWPVRWREDGALFGRGTVDAKGCLASFLEVLEETEVPEGCRLTVVGAVEEEVSSSKGAFHVRDSYPADAVVIGEPSGSGTLTIGYFGLFKLGISVDVAKGHSAGKDAVSAPDALMAAVDEIRAQILSHAPEALSALIDLRVDTAGESDRAEAVLNFRVPPGVDVGLLRKTAEEARGADVAVLRATPGFRGGRGGPLVKAFTKSFAAAGAKPRFVVKKGTSDMNTLATTWEGVPMVAYGPGDSSLDHTMDEHLHPDEYRRSRGVLAEAVRNWFAQKENRS